MRTPAMICGSDVPDQDAAMSLCAMGQLVVLDQTPPNDETNNNCPPRVEPVEVVPPSPLLNAEEPLELEHDLAAVAVEDEQQRSRRSSSSDCSFPDLNTNYSNLVILPNCRRKIAGGGKLPPKKRIVVVNVRPAPTTQGQQPPSSSSSNNNNNNNKQQRDRVAFEEMKRLMRVYGPTKCLRNRTPRESGKTTKVLSVKRKFYRWFPDFHDRFVLVEGSTSGATGGGGWYKPKIGHEEEMRYREELRGVDQELLAAKRNAKKNNLDKV